MSLRGRRHGGGRKNELVFYTTCGPTTTFDPKITGVAGTWFFDDGTTLEAASGAEISKTFAAEGLHRAVYRPVGGLAAITAIDFNTDLVTAISTRGLTGCKEFRAYTNAGLVMRISDLPAGLTVASFGGDPLILPASIAHLTKIQDIRIYSMGWLTADVDVVIDSMWGARANYTYATPALQIGGTNQAPTGNVTAPVEGADWHQDGATWIPLTTGAKAYDLAKDVNSEGFNKWTITYTGGVIAP